jgi:hypothetical protein
MEANELRIGNIVERYTDIFGRGWSWTNTSHEDIYSIACGHEDKYRPIPLTEEWLIKFGFEPLTKKSKGFKADTYSYTGRVVLILNHDGVNTWTNFWQGNEMKYVHQLQNLYFALTNEELTIND